MNYKAYSIENYLEEAAAQKAVPGGGSVSALVGALASTMAEMTGNFTTGKEKYKEAEEQIKTCLRRLKLSRNKLLNLTSVDAEAYNTLTEAYKMSDGTEEEQEKRKDAIQKALKDAMRVPLNVMHQCASVADTAAEMVDIANPNLLTDVGVCAILAESACAAARLNVKINLKYMESREITEETQSKIKEYMATTQDCREKVVAKVDQHLD